MRRTARDGLRVIRRVVTATTTTSGVSWHGGQINE